MVSCHAGSRLSTRSITLATIVRPTIHPEHENNDSESWNLVATANGVNLPVRTAANS
jgi:hypothetical protein